MEWVDAETNPPSIYKDYVCLAQGRITMAAFREYIYDVKRPNWSVDGVTHYLKDVPPFPEGAGE
ncbi:hypothetical protein [Paraburkholderia sp. BL9I2N2]|uniref:hypothetical protein n=1 Tax=Paraburkholderia sp. BL9I2N2 TaxID=1938809 RepID=UPI0010532EAE|nr:hypothetical protein [Paraburkholderia sp. BL9I2N2]